ncbi:hypothetical protein AB0F17_26570 [Nonomuraea sp. NPDC026600]|uniref:hypothetical protein n=1 Tax=Nonomuraea sp. NPDC026600 TaxID=3155363 RepID=UPI0033E94CB0
MTDTNAATCPPESTRSFDPAGRRVMIVCAAGGFTTLLDQSVLNIAIPALRDSLHADVTQVQWMVAGYSLAFGLALSACAMLAGGLVALLAPRAGQPLLLGVCAMCAGAASGLVISPLQASVLQHAPTEAAGVAGGILQMAQRISAAICVSAVSGVYLNASEAGGYGPAYLHAALACAGVAAAAMVVSLLGIRTAAAARRKVTRGELPDRATPPPAG